MKKIVITAILITLTIVASSCAPKRRYDPNANRARDLQNQGFLDHSVTYSGETLSIIAQWYTGRTDNWRLIADANPGLRPERIRLGDSIQIPRHLVVEDAPLPEGFVRKFRGAASAPKKDAKPVEKAQDAKSSGDAQDPAKTPTGEASAEDLFESEKPVTSDTSAKDSAVEVPKTDPAAPPKKEDAEREKLLDELLSQ